MQLLAQEMPALDFQCAASIPGTRDALCRDHFDLLLLDVFMPGGNTFAFLQELRDAYPRLPILVLSSAPEEQLGLRVLRAGANGYLDKQAATDRLVEATRKVFSGGIYVSAALAEQLAAEACRGDHPLHDLLSEREFQIMNLVIEGRSLKEIAGHLSLSVKTVRTFHARMLAKLRLQSDVHLVFYALNHGLVETPCLPHHAA
jgi:two-component system invasion response regulator UvrY